MLDVREACEILGVRENASKMEVEKRFSVLLKKYRSASGQAAEDSGQMDLNRITEAYNLLMGYAEEVREDAVAARPNPMLQKMGIDEKKARNFFYYYKFHILAGIALVLILIFSVKSCVNRVPPDLNIAFIGNIYYADSDVVKDVIRTRVPAITEPSIDGAYLYEDMDGEQQYAMEMKRMVLIAGADVDVYILDKANYEELAEQGAFLSLDGLEATLGIDPAQSKDEVIKLEDSQEQHLFGVDVGSSPIFKEADVLGDEKIAAIGIKAKNYEKAIALIQILIQK